MYIYIYRYIKILAYIPSMLAMALVETNWIYPSNKF